MRYWVYDEDNKLFRKFWTRWEASRFIQEGWKIIVKMKEPEHKPVAPTPETHGEARW
jgi:hypothetical protein